MSFLSWQNVRNFYQYYCKNNKDFLQNIHKIPRAGYDDECCVKKKDEIMNTDVIESTNQIEELTELYKQNKLITSRMGCVEVYIYDKTSCLIMIYLLILSRSTDIDYNMKT